MASLVLVFSTYMLVTAENKLPTEELVSKATIGTWILTSRELPDGTLVEPPEISGLTMCTKNYLCMTALNPLGHGKYNVWVMGGSDIEISDKSMKFKNILSANVSQGDESGGTVNPKPDDIEWGVEIVDGKVKLAIGDGSELVIDGDITIHIFANGMKDTWTRVE